MRTFITAAALLLIVTAVFGQTSVTLDNVTLSPNQQDLMLNAVHRLQLRVTNLTDCRWAFQHGFRVYSPDGATWTQTSGAWLNNFQKEFDILNQIQCRSCDGANDTIIFAGVPFADLGLRPGWDSLSWEIIIGPISPDATGKTICLDSTWFPPAGDWRWADMGPCSIPGDIMPDWNGPHCLSINFDCCQSEYRGNVDMDPGGNVDVGDITMMIEFLFLGRTPPTCLSQADADGDGTVDVGDITRLADYLFVSGTLPASCL